MLLKVLSIVLLLLMVSAMMGLLVCDSLFSASPVSIGVQCVAVILMVWARVTFGWRSFHVAANPTVGGLVTSGPYHFIRHPIYTAFCLFGWAGVLANWSVVTALLGTVLFVSALGRILLEEHLVIARCPEYLKYAQVTKRMIPHIF